MRLVRSAAALLTTLVLAGCAGHAPRTGIASAPPSVTAAATPAPTIRVGGSVLAQAGSSPFAGVVTPARNSRDLVLQITQLPSGGAVPACVGVQWRPRIQESAEAVMITLVGYAPEDSGRCIDGLDATVPFPVTLAAPLGARRLVDGSTRTVHGVFDESTLPLPSSDALPSGVEAGPVRWDEKTDVAVKRWQSADPTAKDSQDVWISIGPERGIAAGAPVPSRTAQRVQIGTSLGRMWHGGGPYDVVVVRFQRGSRVIEVRTVQKKGRTDTTTRALRIACSLH